MPTRRKAFISAGVVAILLWQVVSHTPSLGRPELATDGFPICDSRFMKRAVQQALNNSPAARRHGFEASEVLNGTAVAELPVYRHLTDEYSKQFMQGKCQHIVLTNQGQRSYTSSFQWIDKDGGRYFIEVD